MAEGEPQSPAGPLVADAESEGYEQGRRLPYHGYYFRILKSQGPNGRGGEKDYIVDGKMTGGFAILAYPAEYGASGVMTFLVSPRGTVFQKDLGDSTADSAPHSTSHHGAAGDSAPRHGTSHKGASGDSASRHSTSRYRATAAAAAGLGEYDVVLNDSVGCLVEDVERREADVGDFLLAQRDFARRCGIP